MLHRAPIVIVRTVHLPLVVLVLTIVLLGALVPAVLCAVRFHDTGARRWLLLSAGLGIVVVLALVGLVAALLRTGI